MAVAIDESVVKVIRTFRTSTTPKLIKVEPSSNNLDKKKTTSTKIVEPVDVFLYNNVNEECASRLLPLPKKKGKQPEDSTKEVKEGIKRALDGKVDKVDIKSVEESKSSRILSWTLSTKEINPKRKREASIWDEYRKREENKKEAK